MKNPQYDKNIKVINERFERLNKRVLDEAIQAMNIE
jgi:hypothetical protein